MISRVILHEVNQLVKQKVIQEAKKFIFIMIFIFASFKNPLNELEKQLLFVWIFLMGKPIQN